MNSVAFLAFERGTQMFTLPSLSDEVGISMAWRGIWEPLRLNNLARVGHAVVPKMHFFTQEPLTTTAKGQPGVLPQVYDHQSALMRDYNPLPSSQLDGGLTGLRLTIEVQAAYPLQAHEALHRWRGTWDPGAFSFASGQ